MNLLKFCNAVGWKNFLNDKRFLTNAVRREHEAILTEEVQNGLERAERERAERERAESAESLAAKCYSSNNCSEVLQGGR